MVKLCYEKYLFGFCDSGYCIRILVLRFELIFDNGDGYWGCFKFFRIFFIFGTGSKGKLIGFDFNKWFFYY